MFYIFYFKVILVLQKSCKNNTEGSRISSPKFPSYLHIDNHSAVIKMRKIVLVCYYYKLHT